MKNMYERYRQRRDKLAEGVAKSRGAMTALWVAWLMSFSLFVSIVGGWWWVVTIYYVAFFWLSMFLGAVVTKWLTRMMISSALATYDVMSMSKDGALPPPTP